MSGKEQVTNSAAVDFGTMTADLGTVAYWGIYDAQSSGNLLLVRLVFAQQERVERRRNHGFDGGNRLYAVIRGARPCLTALHTTEHRLTVHRPSSFEWLATANAETDASAAVKVIRYLNGAVEAVAEARGVIIRVVLPSAIAEAESSSVGDYIRILFFDAMAEAVATATATGVSTYGSITMQFPGLTMTAGTN